MNKLLIIALAFITSSFESNHALLTGGPEFEMIKCGFAEDIALLYNEEHPSPNQEQRFYGENQFFWMALSSYNERYYHREYFEEQSLPIRIKILRKTGINYDKASTLEPIIDERTFREYDPNKRRNIIYAFVPIAYPRGSIAVNVVNLRNRPVECIFPDNCQFNLNVRLK